MKKIKALNLLGSILVVAAFALILKSCKKADNTATTTTEIQKSEAAQQAAIASIKQKYGNVSGGVVYNFLKKADQVFFRDKDGKMKDVKFAPIDKGPATSSIICPDCALATSLGQLTRVFTLNYVKRVYKCESTNKSTLIANWTIDVPYHPMSDYSDNITSSYGTISITAPGGGSPLTHDTYNDNPLNTTPGDLKITYLGTGSCFRNRLYSITYSFDQVPDSYFGNTTGTAITCALNIEDDCSWTGGITSASANGVTPSTDSYLPCNRTDLVYNIPPIQSLGNYATSTALYGTCTNPGGFLGIDAHQVEYREVNSVSSVLWADQSTTIYWGEMPVPPYTEVPSMGTGGVLNLKHMLYASGTWIVRYRNVKTSVCDILYLGSPGAPGANWGSEFTWVEEVIVP
jgi:hypothetical protein